MLGLIQKQMYVLRHNDISSHNKSVFTPSPLKRSFEEAFCFGRAEIGETVVATEGEKVHVAGLVVRTSPDGMRLRIHVSVTLPGPKIRTWGTPIPVTGGMGPEDLRPRLDCGCGDFLAGEDIAHAADLCAYAAEFFFDAFVASVHVVDAVEDGFAVRDHCCEDERS